MFKKVRIGSVFLVLSLATAFYFFYDKKNHKTEDSSIPPSPLNEYVVQEVVTPDLKAVPATVDSVRKSFARSRLGGTVDGLSITEGQHVKAGDLLAVIIDPKQPLDIASLDGKLKSLENELNLATTEKKRIEILKKQNVVSQSALDKVTTDVSVLENTLKSTQAEREKLLINKGEGRVFAPLLGQVLKVLVTNGSVVLPGDNIAEIAVDGVILRLNVPERLSDFLKEGMELKVKDPPHQEADQLGTIQKIYPRIEQGKIVVDLIVPTLKKEALVGQLYSVYIPTSKRKTFFIPETFIKKRRGLCYVTLKNNQEVVVQTGEIQDHMVEILSGLEINDVLVEVLS
ncbi:MAG TPA: efflux RND transporter periplasmic adaptor subunit [Alphaproteobacteria bacterium]|nr:efflux RND transporter periplasmic adaptor subunit [Alphaproteobacteria bacterium]